MHPRIHLSAILLVLAAAAPSAARAQCDGGTPNGVLAPTEACDDNNLTVGDGCDAMCSIEAGWSCDRPVSFTGIRDESYPGAAASWTVSAGGRVGVQNNNTGHGTVGLIGADGFAATYRFRLRVNAGDDDFIGFVFGYNSGDVTNASADFLMLDWKGVSQTTSAGLAAAGMAVSRVQGLPTSTNLWAHTGAVTEITRGATLGSTGWVAATDYLFTITYTPTLLTVTVDVGGTVTTEFSVTPAMAGYAGSFPTGEVGFYGYSQRAALYEVLGPFGSSSCNQAPMAADQRAVRVLGSGPVDVDVTRDFTDPNGHSADGGSVTIVTGPATGSAVGTGGGAPSGSVRVSPAAPDVFGTQTLTYRICDDHPTVPLCDTATVTVVTVECVVDGDCAVGTCDASNTCSACTTAADCSDGNDCTMDECSGGACSNPSLAAGAACSGGACDGAATAPMCVVCVDTASGTDLDAGCGAATPICDDSGATPVCVECLATSDCGAGEICAGTMCTTGCRMNSDCAGRPTTPVCDVAAEACVACVEDSHCGAGEVCSAARTCVQCIGDRGCAEGLTCSSNTCTTECRADTDCTDPNATVCDAGVCVGCVRTSECSGADVCIGGQCGTACTMDTECTGDKPECDETAGICVECTEDGQCGSGMCDEVAGTCVTACTTDGDCSGARAECDVAAGVCVQCASDAACEPALTCNEARGLCVECTEDGQCLTGETCSAAGTCIACSDSSSCTSPDVCDPDLRSCGSACGGDADCANPRLPICDSTSTTCDECRRTADCQGTEVCVVDGRCEPPCATAADCMGDQVCNTGTGLCVDGCAADTDCSAPTPVCIDNMCAGCRADSDCGAGRICDAVMNRCVDGCRNNTDCDAGELCDRSSNTCVSGCRMDSECTDPMRPACSDGMCALCRPGMEAACAASMDGTACVTDGAAVRCGCDSATDCAEGRVCDSDTSRCVDRTTEGGIAGGALCAIRAGSSSPAPLIPLFACFAAVGLAIWRRRR